MRRTCLPVATVVFTLLLPASAIAADPQPQPFLEGLAFPTNMAFTPNGTLLFTEKETGNVRVVTPSGELLERPFVTLPVIPDAERGLLGIAVHPDFIREPWVYLYRSDPADGLNRLVRVRADGTVAVGELQTLLDGISAVAGYHNGGDLVFGTDGTLFISLGEAHEPDRAQDVDDIGGKVARLTAEGGVPADNPFGPDNPVWSSGHRNSFGLCIDAETGELWETENGPDVNDEVNLVDAGGNYGWPAVTGVAGDDRFVDPVVVFPEPIALTGCAVVDGDVWFGSFDGRLWRLAADARRSGEVDEIAGFPSGVTDVTLGPNGLLHIATVDAIWTLRPDSETGSTAIPTPSEEPAASSSPKTDAPTNDDDAWRSWVGIGALVVLAGALGARFLAGKRLRGGRPDDVDR